MKCVHPSCARDDLPPAPAFPLSVRMPCAHVRGDGEPCSESPHSAYDDEAHGVIAAEPALWDPEVRPDGLEAPSEAPASDLEQIRAREVGKSDRRAGAKRRLDDSSKAQIAARLASYRSEAPPEETKVLAPPSKPPTKKKAPAKPASSDAQDDIDDWQV